MSTYNYMKLQNGTDIRGVALADIPSEPVNLDTVETQMIAKSFLLWLSSKTKKEFDTITISIGHDSRLSAHSLKAAFIEALLPFGVTVLDAGLSSTPAMFMSTIFKEYACDGAIMITASHLPFNRNGFKFFDVNGGLNKGDITQILSCCQSQSELSSMVKTTPTKLGVCKTIDLIGTYSAHLRQMIIDQVDSKVDSQMPLKGMNIVVDAGNGAGGFYATEILANLGANISNSQFLNPDGTFPNHPPNPEDKNAMESICKKVRESKADFGLIFDTDVDRSSAVDGNGREINRNGIVALAAALIADEHPGTTVVTDSITSDQLTSFLENQLGLKHLRFKRGYKNVINKSIELNQSGVDSQLAIETSGHAAYKENYFLDDGAYLATKIVIKAAKLNLEGKTLDSLISSLKEPMEASEIRFPIVTEDFGKYGDVILSDLEEWGKKNQALLGCNVVSPNFEGVRISFDNPDVTGWCLLRKSLHDPIMPFNVETTTVGGCNKIYEYLIDFLADYQFLDTAQLEKLIK
ncbi:MAG: phosphomannomutase/phosphoglucomutase [Anaerovoracaceae bacterium]